MNRYGGPDREWAVGYNPDKVESDGGMMKKPQKTTRYRDRGSWKKTLHEKAIGFEKNTQQRHNILGSYPSSVRLIPPKHYAGTQQGAWKTLVETGELSVGWTTAQLDFAPQNTHVLYAVGKNGIYRSADMGEREIGAVWHSISGNVSSRSDCSFAVNINSSPAKLYLLTRHGFYSKAEDALEWSAFPQTERIRGFSTVDSIGGTPLWLRVDQHSHRIFRAVEVSQHHFQGAFISLSEDNGETWSPIVRELKPLVDWSLGTLEGKSLTRDDIRQFSDLRRQFPIQDLRVDQQHPDIWYGQMTDGVALTEDAGHTWRISGEGLDIPQVHAIWTPRRTDLVMVGTPGGAYISRDHGQTWNDTSLILQEEGASRSEIGGIGYLTAYWMGRYHGFISEEEANRAWWKAAAATDKI